MILNDKTLAMLVEETDRIIADPEYRSIQLYMIIDHLAYQYVGIAGYGFMSRDIKDALQLDSIMRVFRKLPRYSDAKGAEARARNGLPHNRGRAIYKYIEVIIITSMYESLKRKRNQEVPTISLDEIYGTSGRCLELCDIDTDDIDNRIDEERRVKRIADLNKRIDIFEAQLAAMPKRKVRTK